MTNEPAALRAAASADEEADAVLAACRVLMAVSAQVAWPRWRTRPTVTQVRALVVIASRGSVSLGELAAACGVHLTSASRLCDRLVAAGLMDRADDPANRRQLTLTLTPER